MCGIAIFATMAGKAMRYVVRAVKYLLLFSGGIACTMLVLSFTDLPFSAYQALSLPHQRLENNPEHIVILGGAGMPSADGLQRTHFGALAAKAYPNATVFIALPKNENDEDSLYQLRLMAKELVLKGVDTNRIYFESRGFNTHSQAQNLFIELSSDSKRPLLLVTSPEHMYRAVSAFEKVGFEQVGGLPTFEVPVDENQLKDKEALKKLEIQNVDLRYNMWSYLQYEIRVAREYTAISYYWMMGWI